MDGGSKDLLIAIKVACPLCGKVFPGHSRRLFNLAAQNIDIALKKICTCCRGNIDQIYWTERGADSEIRLCIGNNRDRTRVVATLSGMLTTNGIFDREKLKIFKRQGLKMELFKDLPEKIQGRINKGWDEGSIPESI